LRSNEAILNGKCDKTWKKESRVIEVSEQTWEQNVRKCVPYVAGEQPEKQRMIKLNTNECPYPPAPGVKKAEAEMNLGNLRLYPDQNVTSLVNALAEYYHVSPKQVFVGVGSDDVLATSFLTFFNSDKPILFPDVTYSFYDVWANLYRIPFKTCPLDDDWRINPEDYKQPNGGVIFPNPNAPTGVFEPLTKVEEIIKANRDVVVIVDEAYVDFGGESALPLVEKYDNLLVVQTFSKSRSMAGLRIGFCIGSEKLIKYLNDVKFSINSYTMNRPALALGVEAVKDDAYFKMVTGKIIATRERVKKELAKLGFTFPDSKTNFLFASHKTVPAKEIFEALREKDIYVRHWNKPRIDNSLRITIGTDEEMDVLIAFLKEYLANK
jgi:histidinol-phosphate aminotransferase